MNPDSNIRGIAYKQKIKKRSFINSLLKYKYLYLLILPGAVYFFIYKYLPMAGIIIAFNSYHPAMGIKGIFTAQWIGFRNFEIFFQSIYFERVMINTIVISLLKMVFGFPAPIILALMLNEIRALKFKKTIQTISYLPHFISWVVVGGIMYELLSTTGGPINNAIKAVLGKPINFLYNPDNFRGVVVASDIWKEIGWGTIIYIAALSNVDIEQYQAAIIDGANRMQQLIYITLPAIASTIIIMLLLRLGHILDAGFHQILILYSPPVYGVGDIIDTHVYREGLGSGRYGYATAVGLFKHAIGLVMIVGANMITKKLGHEGIF